MRFISAADIHRRSTRPKHRIDNFQAVQDSKLEWCLNQCVIHKAPLLIAGDVHDSAFQPDWLKRDTAKLLVEYGVDIYAVFGQHDLRHHSIKNWRNTPLALLEGSGLISIAREESTRIGKGVYVFGASWEEEPPTVLPLRDKPHINILLMHRMVTKSGPLWPGQTDYSEGEAILRKYPMYQYIITGDNHHPFVVEYKGRFLINPGALLRTNSDQMDHHPRIYLVDTDKNTVEPFHVPIHPAEVVFNLDNIEKDQVRKENIKAKEFVDSLKVKTSDRPVFTEILHKVMKKAKAKTGVRNFIDEMVEKATR